MSLTTSEERTASSQVFARAGRARMVGRAECQEDSLSIEIREQRTSGPTLVEDYLRGETSAVQFYAGAPDDLAVYRRKAEEVRSRFGRAEREAAAQALTPTSNRARERLARFVAEGGIMVTTGQQAGLLTGPLYTLYKALTAVRLAATLERELGMLVLPVFWTASEDHDWDEVNHAYLSLTRDGVRRVQLTDDPPHPFPMSEVPLGEGVITILDEISDLFVGNDDNADLIMWIHEAYRPDASVARSFSELMTRLLASFDLCMTDAAHPAIKRTSNAVLWEALERNEEHERLLVERTASVAAAGYHGQVAVMEAGTNVFRHGSFGRERLYRAAGGFSTGGGGAVLSLDSLRAEMEEIPAAFSPNVFLRPVVESAVFPTVAYVGGPGEMSYFAQLSALFPAFGMSPPVVYPRASLLLVELPMRRLLDKLELEPEGLERPRHELIELLAQGSFPDSLRDTLEELGRGVTDRYRELIEEAKQIDPTLEGALARLRNEALARIGESERKITQHIKRKESVRIGQLERLLDHLRPEGKPQDRVLNGIPYLARHGLSLLTRMYEAIRVELK